MQVERNPQVQSSPLPSAAAQRPNSPPPVGDSLSTESNPGIFRRIYHSAKDFLKWIINIPVRIFISIKNLLFGKKEEKPALPSNIPAPVAPAQAPSAPAAPIPVPSPAPASAPFSAPAPAPVLDPAVVMQQLQDAPQSFADQYRKYPKRVKEILAEAFIKDPKNFKFRGQSDFAFFGVAEKSKFLWGKYASLPILLTALKSPGDAPQLLKDKPEALALYHKIKQVDPVVIQSLGNALKNFNALIVGKLENAKRTNQFEEADVTKYQSLTRLFKIAFNAIADGFMQNPKKYQPLYDALITQSQQTHPDFRILFGQHLPEELDGLDIIKNFLHNDSSLKQLFSERLRHLLHHEIKITNQEIFTFLAKETLLTVAPPVTGKLNQIFAEDPPIALVFLNKIVGLNQKEREVFATQIASLYR